MKRHLEKLFKGDAEGFNAAKKSFNSNGYKTVKIQVYGEALTHLSKMQIGSIIGLANPRPMKASAEFGYTYIIEAGAAIFKIGISEDLSFCKSAKASAVMSGMIDMNQYTVQCR